MRIILLFTTLICTSGIADSVAQDLGSEYVTNWKLFYPSDAVKNGFHHSIFQLEDFSAQRIEEWVGYNQGVLDQIDASNSVYVFENPIDARLLKMKIKMELDKWLVKTPEIKSLRLYTRIIRAGLETLLDSDFLIDSDRESLVGIRIDQFSRIIKSAQRNIILEDVESHDREANSLERITKSLSNLETNLNSRYGIAMSVDDRLGIDRLVKDLEEWEGVVLSKFARLTPQANEVLGAEEYAKQLQLYLDTDMQPEELAEMAFKEIQVVKNIIAKSSRSYLKQKNADYLSEISDERAIEIAFADMENDAPTDGEDYLEFWQDLSVAATQFLIDHDIATLPKNETLQIKPAPESAGPAARIGWVASAPPFAPNPMTTLYLPSIPDSLNQKEKTEFWSSFNKPFNRMIVIHELIPGHYMQLKIARESPHPIRLLFPYGIYIEGWATFCERILLDAGWQSDDPLTFLAHLRKRLENANRAYTSVMVHCHGWNQDQVIGFSTETSLVAPQFAKSLWGRLIRSPMQMTSYFLGGLQFAELYQHEQERLGTSFELKEFMDTILKSGAIAIEDFYGLFKKETTVNGR